MIDILSITVKMLESGKRAFNRNKPRIFMIGGIGLSAAGTITACAQTYKHIDRILDTCKENLDAAEELPEEEVGKEKAKVLASTAGDLVKTYALPVALSAAGYGGIIYANHLQEQRQAVLSEALTTLGAAYATYKKRVEERFGKENAEAALLDSSEATVMTDEGDGKKPKKEEIEIVNADSALDASPFAKFFDESSRNWEDNAEYNMTFLKLMEKECNHILQMDGYLILADVYKKLDIPVTKASLVAGWIKDNEEISDNYVDFGVFDYHDRSKRRFVNGLENVVLLDFNCSSNIADYI